MESMNRTARPWRSDPITRLVTLAPFALALYIDLVARPFAGLGSDSQPEALGISPAGWLQLAVLTWAAVGAFIVWTTNSRVASAVAFVLFTPVAIFGLVLGPAVLLILQNLAGGTVRP